MDMLRYREIDLMKMMVMEQLLMFSQLEDKVHRFIYKALRTNLISLNNPPF